MVDTHCHLYLDDFSSDIKDIISRARDAGVSKFYMPAIDRETLPSLLELEANYPGTCFAMIGLHPCSVKENYQEELENLSQWLSKRRFAAIGETGLDLYWIRPF
jgi:TatD DNase family protein